MNKIYGVVLLVLALAVISGGFYLFNKHEQTVAFERNTQCHSLAVTYWQNAQSTFASLYSNKTKSVEPQSHFNSKLNTCLGYFEATIYLPASASSPADTLLDNEIVDVVADKVLLNSTTDMGDGSESGQVSEQEFDKQEAILMSQ